MAEQSASALGWTLLDELVLLRVETLVAGPQDKGAVNLQPVAGSIADAPIGKLPPTDAGKLIQEVENRFARDRQFGAAIPVTDLAVGEVANRRTAALALLQEIDPLGHSRRGPMGRTVAPADTATPPPPEIDQTQARRLARHWELGQRPVACRTLVGMNGDSVTQFPGELSAAQPISHDSLTRAHGHIALAAMSVWPVLFSTAGSLIAVFIPRHPKFGIALGWRRTSTANGGDSRFTWAEFLRHGQSFLAWGRVVFESPDKAGAKIRSMVHPSGDIETTILQDATDDLLLAHAEAVATWVRRMEASLRFFTTWLERISVLVWILLTTVPAGVYLARTREILLSTGLMVIFAIAGWILRWCLRWWLQRKLTSLTTNTSEAIHTLENT